MDVFRIFLSCRVAVGGRALVREKRRCEAGFGDGERHFFVLGGWVGGCVHSALYDGVFLLCFVYFLVLFFFCYRYMLLPARNANTMMSHSATMMTQKPSHDDATKQVPVSFF